MRIKAQRIYLFSWIFYCRNISVVLLIKMSSKNNKNKKDKKDKNAGILK